MSPHRLPIINDERIEIDFSAADAWLRCGQSYRFRYVDGLKEKPGIALLEGSAHHKVMEKNNLLKREKGRDFKATQLTEYFVYDLRKRLDEEGGKRAVNWQEENEDKIIKRAKILHADYINHHAPRIHPEKVEERFERQLKLEGEKRLIIVYGTIDLTEKPIVWDYKAVAKAKSQAEADSSVQLSLYSFAANKNEVGFISFVKKGNPEVVPVTARRTASQKLWALRVIVSVAKSIQGGAFPLADPMSWKCSERFCGFWKRCRGKYQ